MGRLQARLSRRRRGVLCGEALPGVTRPASRRPVRHSATDDVQAELRERGTVGLYVDARLVRLTDALGVVADACATETGFWEENHCVACVRVGTSTGGCAGIVGADCCARRVDARVPWKSLPQRPGYFVLSFLYPPLDYFGDESVWFAHPARLGHELLRQCVFF